MNAPVALSSFINQIAAAGQHEHGTSSTMQLTTDFLVSAFLSLS
jgi:hypothetical protein